MARSAPESALDSVASEIADKSSQPERTCALATRRARYRVGDSRQSPRPIVGCRD